MNQLRRRKFWSDTFDHQFAWIWYHLFSKTNNKIYLMFFYRFIHRRAYVQEQFWLLQKSHQARRCYRSLPWFSTPINGSGSRKSHQANGKLKLFFFTISLWPKPITSRVKTQTKKKLKKWNYVKFMTYSALIDLLSR